MHCCFAYDVQEKFINMDFASIQLGQTFYVFSFRFLFFWVFSFCWCHYVAFYTFFQVHRIGWVWPNAPVTYWPIFVYALLVHITICEGMWTSQSRWWCWLLDKFKRFRRQFHFLTRWIRHFHFAEAEISCLKWLQWSKVFGISKITKTDCKISQKKVNREKL